jgi:organic hydroperoxide reductase OsmC/OhrA
VQVVSYTDSGEGKLGLVSGRMSITHVTLQPVIHLAPGADREKARALVEKAHAQCFIANSVTTKVQIQARIETV